MKIADFIIDSRIGALDRTLGFLFGAARGILLLVVATAFWNWLVDVDHRPNWVNSAKSKPFLDSMVVKLQSVLPAEFAQMVRASVMEKIQPQGGNAEGGNAPASDQAPAEDAAPAPANGAQQPSN
jgi:membrane protein required for colicin V production